MTNKRLIIALLPLALLAACNDQVSDDSRSASGEVLEGTISDAMLPLDQVRSQPPLVAPRSRSTGADDADEAEAGEGPGAAEDGTAPAEIVAPAGLSATPAVEPPAEADD